MAKRKADESTPTTETRQIGARKLKELLASSRKAYKDVREIAGSLGAEIKDAVENHRLHRKAFSVLKTADRMEPEKLLEFRDTLLYYFDIGGIDARCEQASRLNLGDGRPGEKTGDDSKVKPFPRPTSVAAE